MKKSPSDRTAKFSVYPANSSTQAGTSPTMTQELRDNSGRLIAKIETRLADGPQIIRDAAGRKRGEYDPKANVTRDASGRKLGQGNMLSSLVR